MLLLPVRKGIPCSLVSVPPGFEVVLSLPLLRVKNSLNLSLTRTVSIASMVVSTRHAHAQNALPRRMVMAMKIRAPMMSLWLTI
jgi:hypothetical protein